MKHLLQPGVVGLAGIVIFLLSGAIHSWLLELLGAILLFGSFLWMMLTYEITRR